jgi:two-component system cell cycle sensor histidine kinase PleC
MPARNRRAASQRVREARDRLTSTSGTRPAFDHELLRQHARTRISASLVVVLLVAAAGLLSSLWVRPINAAIWTFVILCVHALTITSSRKFLGEQSTPAALRTWRMRFILTRSAVRPGLDLHSGPSGGASTSSSNTLLLFVMLLVVAVSSMLASSLPIAAFAATAPVTAGDRPELRPARHARRLHSVPRSPSRRRAISCCSLTACIRRRSRRSKRAPKRTR